jgi:ApbE superfamily uncharacterized protein (UPF0280 family)
MMNEKSKKDLVHVRWSIKQTNMVIQTDIPKAVNVAKAAVRIHRVYLEDYIRRNPLFLASLEPIEVEDNAPEIIRRMAAAGLEADVGPMAAVAGALADLAVEAMGKTNAKVRVVENGGEIAAVSDVPIYIGVYAGDSPISGKIGFRVSYLDMPIGVGTSSATVSHAISFGQADSATVFAYNAALADAAATATGNAVKGRDVEASIQKGLEAAEKIKGVKGAFIIRGRHVGAVGRIPELVKITGKLDIEKFKLFDVSKLDAKGFEETSVI